MGIYVLDFSCFIDFLSYSSNSSLEFVMFIEDKVVDILVYFSDGDV